jgi:hypothetical protein
MEILYKTYNLVINYKFIGSTSDIKINISMILLNPLLFALSITDLLVLLFSLFFVFLIVFYFIFKPVSPFII